MILALAKGLGAAVLLALLAACASHIANSGRPKIPAKDAAALRVATFNVHWVALRQEDGPWSPAGFERRKGAMTASMQAIGPDVLALQEAESFPATNRDGTNLVVAHLLETLEGLELAASGPPDTFPPTQPILYRSSALEVRDEGWFFFSQTPDEMYARTFNGGFAAFASWAEFAPVSGGSPFRVVNIHTDFASRSNRRQSAALVRDRIAPWIAAGQLVVVVGDMNALRGSATLRLMEEAGVTFLPVPGATVHFNRGLNLFGAIDHIGLSAGLTAGTPVVVRQKFGEVWPSDHYPVFADIAQTAR